MAPIRVVDTRKLDTAIASVTQTISMCCVPVVPVVAALAVELSGADRVLALELSRLDRVLPDAFITGTEQQ